MKALKYSCWMALIGLCLSACNLEVIPDGGASGTFIKKLGTSNVVDKGFSIIETSDKKLLITGETRASGFGGADISLIKLDAKGIEIWSKSFGGSQDDAGFQVRELKSNNYKITGKYTEAGIEKLYSFETVTDGTQFSTPLKMTSQSEGRGMVELSGRFCYFGTINLCGASSVCNHFWLFQTDFQGTDVGTNDGYGSGINTLGASLIVSDNGTGNLFGVGKQYTNNANQYDPYLIRMPNSFLNIQTLAIKILDEAGNQSLNGVVQLSDRTLVAVGETENNAQGTSDILFLRYDENLNLVGSPVKIGGSGIDRANAIIRTSDDKLVIVGETSSKGAGDLDLYLVKVDLNGTIIWERTFGGAFKDGGSDVFQATNGDLLISGYTQNTSNASDVDAYIIRSNAEGKVQ